MEGFRIYVTNYTRGARVGWQVDFEHAVQIGDSESRHRANLAAAGIFRRLPGEAAEEYASILVADEDGTIVTVYGPEPADEEPLTWTCDDCGETYSAIPHFCGPVQAERAEAVR